MVRNAEVGGIIVSVDESSFNDWELLEMAASFDASKPDIPGVARFAVRFFGREQWDRIKSELKEKTGDRLPIDTVVEFIFNAFNALAKDGEAVKN